MADGDMIFNFFRNINKNSQEHGGTLPLKKVEKIEPQVQPKVQQPKIAQPILTNARLQNEDIRKKNIETMRSNVQNTTRLIVQNSYDTPKTSTVFPKNDLVNTLFPNSRTGEKETTLNQKRI